MNFVTPAQYSKSNLAHFHINCRAVNDFVKIYPALGREDRSVRLEAAVEAVTVTARYSGCWTSGVGQGRPPWPWPRGYWEVWGLQGRWWGWIYHRR